MEDAMPKSGMLENARKNRIIMTRLGKDATYEQVKAEVEAEGRLEGDGRTINPWQFYDIRRRMGWAAQYRKGPRTSNGSQVVAQAQATPQTTAVAVASDPQLPPRKIHGDRLNEEMLLPRITAMVKLVAVVDELGGIEATYQALDMLLTLQETRPCKSTSS